MYVAQVLLANAHISFWGTLSDIYRVKNDNFCKIFDKILNWRLTVPQPEGIWEIENNRFVL